MLNTDKINGYDPVRGYGAVFGAKAWGALNLEANEFAKLPVNPWDKSGWRLFNK